MNVEYINPFIEAIKNVFKETADLDTELGKPFLKQSPYTGKTMVIMVGLTGQIRGQAVFSMDLDAACAIASAMMMGAEVNEMDEMSKSAISELTNMILGNTATIFYKNGVAIDITPPTVLMGENLTISTMKTKTLCIPISLSNGHKIELDISRQE